jgi:CHAT domain-containing protein
VRSPDGEVALVPLGPASRIDSLATAWNDAVRAGATGSWRARNEAIAHRFGIALRARIWDPIASRVRGAGRTFVVPDGTLGLVNLDALPAGADRFLAEVAPPFQYLSSERETVPSLRGTNRGLLAVGGTDFDANPRSVALVAAAFESTPKAPATYRGARSSCSDFNALRFEPLPGSAAEVRVVAGLWRAGAPPDEREQVRLLTGTEAGEAAFKRLAPSARILHVATHGFFLEGTCGGGTTPRARRATSGLQDEAIAGENPLLLSGLALAGSNQRERAATGDDDGVLTAQEIAAMNLDGMEWAVLSACESGVGRVQQREGVLGLPRAFLTAGCRTVVTSLWPVDDRAAQTWMASLYHYRLNDGLATPDCVRAASLEALRGRRHGNASTLPLYWASFLAIGGGR